MLAKGKNGRYRTHSNVSHFVLGSGDTIYTISTRLKSINTHACLYASSDEKGKPLSTEAIKHLGKISLLPTAYDPKWLEFLARIRVEKSNIPYAADLWTLYEVAWLDQDAVLHPFIADLRIEYASQHLVESKSLKLYLYGLSLQPFESQQAFQACILSDLRLGLGNEHVQLSLYGQHQWRVRRKKHAKTEKGLVLEEQAAVIRSPWDQCKIPTKMPYTAETLRMEGFMTHCPVTGQPDWATIIIQYVGIPIDRHQLYTYLRKYRSEQGFHEQCITQIYTDLLEAFRPQKLSVQGRFTRRGGIDINPYRSNYQPVPINLPESRQ